MAISDSNPERRNLVVTSWAFIVYFAAGGHVTDNTIRLAIVNVSLDKPEVLAFIAWAMLLWFCLRFWQSTKSKFMDAFEQEVRAAKVPAGLAGHATALAAQRPKTKGLMETKKATLETSSLHREGTRWVVICHVIVDEQGSRSQVRQENVHVSGWILRRALFRALLKNAVTNNAAAEYFIPYVLFLSAATAPCWSSWV